MFTFGRGNLEYCSGHLTSSLSDDDSFSAPCIVIPGSGARQTTRFRLVQAQHGSQWEFAGIRSGHSAVRDVIQLTMPCGSAGYLGWEVKQPTTSAEARAFSKLGAYHSVPTGDEATPLRRACVCEELIGDDQ